MDDEAPDPALWWLGFIVQIATVLAVAASIVFILTIVLGV